jgi:hypothetical protein
VYPVAPTMPTRCMGILYLFWRRRWLTTPSLRFPLLAGGTERERGAVPLAKRGNLQEEQS